MTATNKQLIVQTPQGEAGLLSKDARLSFRYTTQSPECEVSLTMPLRFPDYTDSVLHAPFEACKPEGYLFERLKARLLKFGKVDDLALLAAVGDHCVGRLSFSTPEGRRSPRAPAPTRDSILASGHSAELFEHLVATYVESGISGVQPKVLLPELKHLTVMQPSLIVKATPDIYPSLAKNEFLCMTAAKFAGLEVPDGFWLSDDGALFVVNRFDVRYAGEEKQRLGFEDLCQLMGKRPSGKYEGSYENVIKALHLYCGDQSILQAQKFFGYLVASVLMRNGDAHLKNFGLLYEHPRAGTPKLSPVYDLTTTSIYALSGGLYDRTLALKLNGSKGYPSLDSLVRFGREKCSVSNPQAVINAVAEGMMKAAAEHSSIFDHEFGRLLFAEWQQSLKSYGFEWKPPIAWPRAPAVTATEVIPDQPQG